MGLTARDKGGGQDFDPVDEGMHHAICYSLFDLGHQYNDKFEKMEHKCLIVWELPDERIEIDGVDLPRAISKMYTLSLNEKANLRRDLESWRGKTFTDAEREGFDIFKLLGINCTLQVLHNTKGEKTYANISSIVPLMKGMAKKTPENPVRRFSFEDGGDIPEGTPDWVKDIIMKAKEWGGDQSQPQDEDAPQDDGDSIPF